ncbi:beta-1,3-galactosyl-O-glycosyl-glycoprotein beta-1,6-N-acetylglucosaminyltransferase 4 isoform X1 [Neoarius graeffei]|uniref:beta-1,3-galactosyl-O-glycosyl-glycoprotein beta-1,6-N-acetylglucosaminyltransferase 4 isoform X1 n=2 Tax=Neoarius graeffei TaxID=443677 RepID=UPI00298C7A2E|nr:beta-1,3-galactosyl-O-glycosyl-glycoprotein beta-1,6-N-acetylglucosaminyltransferase 4 isoform X1 [Neoarius graeffei]XP_060791638.1 beta-1,3-galactosyl-O-glycosyl-glycoprotein beta-1,6-N-acetylglucosaminyltransferase 4 isoform X1 [Neoarius graeffei]
MRMKSCTRPLNQGRTWLFLLLSILVFCGLIRYVKITNDNDIKSRQARGPTDTQWRFTEQYGINCLDIYDMDPVSLGKTLELRKKVPPIPSDMSMVNANLDCVQFLASKGYSKVKISDQERDFPLAFSLVVHKDAYMVERLLRAIYAPHNVYCIHYDLKSSMTFAEAMHGLTRCLPNVFVASRLETVQYGGISRLRADLNCLSDLLNSHIRWRYVINLCGQDFPLRSNAEIVSDLKALKGMNVLETTRPSTFKKQRFTFQFELKDSQSRYHATPVKTNQKKQPPPHNIEIFVGSAYFVLSREFVNFVHWSPLVKDFLAWSEDTYSPDEHFWATLIRIPGVPGAIKRSDPDISDLMSKTRLVKWQYLEGKLYPACTGVHVHSVCIYGAAELRWLLNDGHWFANKFDLKVDPVVIECLERNLTERAIVTTW